MPSFLQSYTRIFEYFISYKNQSFNPLKTKTIAPNHIIQSLHFSIFFAAPGRARHSSTLHDVLKIQMGLRQGIAQKSRPQINGMQLRHGKPAELQAVVALHPRMVPRLVEQRGNRLQTAHESTGRFHGSPGLRGRRNSRRHTAGPYMQPRRPVPRAFHAPPWFAHPHRVRRARQAMPRMHRPGGGATRQSPHGPPRPPHATENDGQQYSRKSSTSSLVDRQRARLWGHTARVRTWVTGECPTSAGMGHLTIGDPDAGKEATARTACAVWSAFTLNSTARKQRHAQPHPPWHQ